MEKDQYQESPWVAYLVADAKAKANAPATNAKVVTASFGSVFKEGDGLELRSADGKTLTGRKTLKEKQ